MKKVLIIILVVLLVAAAGAGGFLWYRQTHIFVDGQAYAKNAQTLDLRETEVSVDHYNAVHAQLPNCHILWNVPFQGGSYSSDTTSLTVASLTEADLDRLAYFPGLKTVNAAGCTDYALLEQLQTRYPGCTVTYQVSLGQQSFDPDVTELTLAPEDFDYGLLLENLQYLPAVEQLTLTKTDLDRETIDGIAAAYENINVDYTVELLGQEYGSQTEELDLSAMTPEDVEAVAQKLGMLENVTSVELMTADGSSALSIADVKTLKDAAPEAVFHYSFEYFGVTISTTDEEVKLANKKIGEDGVEELRQVLGIMENCGRFVLDNCRLSNETLADLREEFRGNAKVVWRIWFSDNGTCLTDAEVIRSVYGLNDRNSASLYYCEDVRFADFGHDETLFDISFVAGMKSLEAIIVSGAPISDLSPFASCENLRFLEIANCTYVVDVSPLASCTNLEMLNISYTGVTDLSPLDELSLTHLTAVHSKVSGAEESRYTEKFPDCWTVFHNGDQPYGKGWRYDKDGITKLPWYEALSEAMRYPEPPNDAGWYLK